MLAVVVAISWIKEVIEDMRRYREDRRLDSSATHVLGSAKPLDRWDLVHVGDILKVNEKDPLPAGIVLVATSLRTVLRTWGPSSWTARAISR